jgi:hypothetical protein
VLVPKPPGIRPLSPAKPDPTADLPTTEPPPSGNPTPEEHSPTTDIDPHYGAAETQVAEAGVRAFVEASPGGAPIK